MHALEPGLSPRAARFLKTHPRLRRLAAAAEVPFRSLCLLRPLGSFALRLAGHLGDDPSLQRQVRIFLQRRGVRTLGLYGDGAAARALAELCPGLGIEVRFWLCDEGGDYAVAGVRIRHSARRDLSDVDAIIACAPALQVAAVFAAARAARRQLSAPVYALFEVFCPWTPHRPRRRGYQHFRELSAADYPGELRLWFYAHTGQELHLENPLTLSAKIQWLKLYAMGARQRQLTDKYRVKQWVAERLSPAFVLPTLGRWESTCDLLRDWERLPERFVLKCTHGSGMTIFVDRRSRTDRRLIARRLEGWQSTDYAFCTGLELQYHGLRPCIMAEPRAAHARGRPIITYRVWCFGGRPHFVEVCAGQESLMCVSSEGEVLALRRLSSQGRSHRSQRQSYLPGLQSERLRRLLSLCRRLCAEEDLPLVRLDFVLRDGRWYFWDLTLTPDSGLTRWSDPQADLRLGAQLTLPSVAAPLPEAAGVPGPQAL